MPSLNIPTSVGSVRPAPARNRPPPFRSARMDDEVAVPDVSWAGATITSAPRGQVPTTSIEAQPVPWPEALNPPLIRIMTEFPDNYGSEDCILQTRFPPTPSEVTLHGGVVVPRSIIRSNGFHGYNNPGGLPLTSENIYLSPDFRQRLIDRINYVNRAYHVLYGTPYYSAEGSITSPSPATTEPGDRILRAFQALREHTGAHSEAYLPALFLYCVLEQEDPGMFNSWARDNGVSDPWESLTASWTGRSIFNRLVHPLINGMMVVPQRNTAHNYPCAAQGSGVFASEVRPMFVLTGGYRAMLNLGLPALTSRRLAPMARYRGLFHMPAAHIHRDNSLAVLHNGGGIGGDIPMSLATPEMVAHFWTRLSPIVSYGNGNEIFDTFWAVLETLGLEEDYKNQPPRPLWQTANSTNRSLWTALGIPTPS